MIRKMTAKSNIASVLAVWLLLSGVAQGGATSVETSQLSVSDATGRLSQEELSALAQRAQATLDRVQALWGVDARTDGQTGGQGKIRVIYNEPLRGQCTSIFYRPAERQRAVRVYGCAEAPLMLAHKLTSALMPQPDKLLRNMWGALSEARVGDPASFPACGQAVDDWALAIARSGTWIPLGQLGPDHKSWGMRDEGDGRLMTFDRPRQQRAYAEAGSFARYLAATYGLDALKRLQRLSHTTKERPWREAFGADLEALEAGWQEALKASAAGREERVGQLIYVLGIGSGDPCERARLIKDTRREESAEASSPPPRQAP